MVQPHEAADGDELALMGGVDADPRAHEPTDPEESQILTGLYGPADAHGFHTGPSDQEQPGQGQPG